MNNVDYRKKQTELGESYSASTELIANWFRLRQTALFFVGGEGVGSGGIEALFRKARSASTPSPPVELTLADDIEMMWSPSFTRFSSDDY